MSNAVKQAVRTFWDQAPCGTTTVTASPGSREFFDRLEQHRYETEPFIASFARFAEWRDKTTLEVGCGAGTDLLQFARAGANAWAVDMSSRSVGLARHHLRTYGFGDDRVLVADAEHLPFPPGAFDLAYSWGVLHHSPDTERTIGEVYRVLKPGGEICIMLYHRFSLVSLQFYLRYGLFSGRPFRGIDDIMASHQESPGTKVYSREEVRRMFAAFGEVTITPVLTPYDLRSGRRPFLPTWSRPFLPAALGYFLVITGRKPTASSGAPLGSPLR